jgi:hypothetical protein
MRVSELYREELISYTYDRINDLQNPLVFSPLPRSGKLYRLTSEDLLARSARMSFSSCLPRMLNSIAPRSHLDKLIGRFGSVFSSIAPDYCFCYRSLAVAASILYLDKSVLLNYAQARSNGGGLSRGALSKDGEDFLKNLGSVGLCHLTPLPEVATVGNAVIHEYLYVQREVQGAFPMLAREPYLQYLQDEVLRMVDSPGKQNMLDVIFAQGLRHQGRPLISSFLEKAALALLSSRFPTQDAALSYALAKSPLVWPHLDKVIHRYGKDTLADGA